MCKIRIENFQHYKHLDYDWLNAADREHILNMARNYGRLFDSSRAKHCINHRCPSKNVRRYRLNLSDIAVKKHPVFQRQLRNFISDDDYYLSLLGFSLIACDMCQHWGVEWVRSQDSYRIQGSGHLYISHLVNNRGVLTW